MKAVIYARQSRTLDGSESLNTQVSACHQAAERLGLTVVAELVEPPSTSGYKERGRNRAKFPELLAGFKDHSWQVVIAYKTDRLSRGGGPGWAPLLDVIENAGLDTDRAVATPSGFVSEFEIGIRAAMDREESSKLSDRMSDIAERRAASGRPHNGGRRPFGYESDYITIKQDEADVLREMAQMLLSGHGYKDIAYYLNGKGITTTTGKLWHPITIRNMLKKKRYGGIREYKGVDYPAQWEPVFDSETWERLQLTMKLKESSKPVGRRYLLTGIVFCGSCGQQLNGQTKRDNPKRPLRRTYACRVQGDTQKEAGCGGVVRNADALEHFVRECIIYRLDSPDLGELLGKKDNGELKYLLEQRKLLSDRITELVDDYASGLLNRAQLARAKQTAEHELSTIQEQIDRQSGLNVSLKPGQTVRDAWLENGDEWRRSLMGLLIKKIVVNKGITKPYYMVDGVRMRFAPELVDIMWVA